MLTRRTLLSRCLLSAAGWAATQRTARAKAPDSPALEPIDALMEETVREHHVVGASLAVAKDGRLVLARGYGLEDKAAGRPVRPETLFCVASVTKAVTAVATLKLVEDGKLDLDARLVDVLSDLKPLPGQSIADPRFRDITVHHLLYHAGGFPHSGAGDGGAEEDDLDASKGAQSYRAAMGRRLEFTPGSDHRYSNFGFIVLRLVIEKASGRPYEAYTRRKVLAPMGITRMHLEGPKRGREETQRYAPGGRRVIAEWNAANWVAAPTDMVRFLSAVAGSGGSTFLSRELTAKMLEVPPKPIQPGRRGGHVGLGWDAVRETPNGVRFGKNGGKPGVSAWLEHLPGNVDWAVMFNTGHAKGQVPNPMNVLRTRFPTVVDSITRWPEHDLFAPAGT